MGILNITPDSFSDGGLFLDAQAAIQKVSSYIASGADIIDIGGQSTRPGASILSPTEELNRILPVIKLIRREYPDVLLSVDTFYSEVAEKSLEIGVNWVNDVSGGKLDPEILNVVADSLSPYVLTHSRGNSLTMNDLALYKNVINDVIEELMIQVDKALSIGISKDKIILDPGIGFAKKDDHNISILANLEKLTNTSFPVLIGPSRKRFIGNLLNEPNPLNRVIGTCAVVSRCVDAKVDIVRVHDVTETKQTILMGKKLWDKKN